MTSPTSDQEFADYLTVKEVAAITRLSNMTIYRLCHAGEMGAIKIGSTYRIPRKGLDEFLKGSQIGSL